MDAARIEAEFRARIGEKVRVIDEGIDRYRVFTPFRFDDGDHLAIVLRGRSGAWVLTDEGHTFMHLTYDLADKDLQKGTRAKIIGNALSEFHVRDDDGELVLPIPDDRYGDALFSFVQAILKVADVSFLSRERVRSTFMEDFRALIDETVPHERRHFDWHEPQRDPDGKYAVDCRINGVARPLFLFALPNDDRVRDATIALHQYERWTLPHRSAGFFEDQEEINRKVLARFSDVCEKLFSSLAPNRDRIVRYLKESLSGDT